MQNTERKKDEEVLAEIYRNAQLALQSISNILPQVEDAEIRTELVSQHEEYEKISSQASQLSKDLGYEVKEPNPFKKMMMWGSIKINSLTDNSRSHIAEMMVQGTVMGITALKTSYRDMCEGANPEIRALCEEMIRMEETFEETWKSYL